MNVDSPEFVEGEKRRYLNAYGPDFFEKCPRYTTAVWFSVDKKSINPVCVELKKFNSSTLTFTARNSDTKYLVEISFFDLDNFTL